MRSNLLKATLLFSAFSAFAVSGFAEAVTVKVPFEFRASGKMLPAGEYVFQEETAGVMVITGSAPGSSVLMMTRSGESNLGTKASLTFTAEHSISCIQMPNGRKLEVVGSTK